METKICARCKAKKSLADFYKRPGAKKVYHFAWCKDCQKKLTAVHSRARYAKIWVKHLSEKYGITEAEYTAMLTQQKGLCSICDRKPHEKRLSVDHCHRTKKVRALLCRHCNLMIGLAEDRPETLIAAAAYLRRHLDTDPLHGL